jgi:DNA-binding NarL/FixJ family response regulator
MSPSLYVIEPQALFVPELTRLVAAAGGRAVRFADSLDVEEIVSLRTDFALVDLDYSDIGVLDGLAFFRGVAPDARVIVLSDETGFAVLEQFRAAGAVAVLSKTLSADEFCDALRATFQSHAILATRIDVLKGDEMDDRARRAPASASDGSTGTAPVKAAS